MTPTGAPGRTEMLNGVPIYFEVHGSGEPLLLLHGFSGCSQDWSAFVGMQTQSPGEEFQVIIPDMRGHGRSFAPLEERPAERKSAQAQPASLGQAGVAVPHEFSLWRHDQAAEDMFAVADHLGIKTFSGLGISGGGNVLLHMATKKPERVKAMVLVSATSYFPAQARPLMRAYADNLSAAERENLRRRHPGGDAQIEAILASAKAFADSYNDLNFTPPYLGRITARTLIVQGDRDPLYPVEISVEMARAIPQSSLWIVPGAGHGPVLGQRWPEFLKAATAFLGDKGRDTAADSVPRSGSTHVDS
jgi:pimeloyl-ACP methyl ester carboxylesterase